MAKVNEVLEAVEKMTVLEISDLVKKMEEKFGVSAAAPVMAVQGGAAGGETEEVKDEFDIVLQSVGAKKIQVLKVVREITGLGLKEAKEMVDAAPKTIKEGIKKAEAEEMKKKLEAEGAKVEVK